MILVDSGFSLVMDHISVWRLIWKYCYWAIFCFKISSIWWVTYVLEMVPYRCCIEDVFGKILIFMNNDQVCQLLGLSKPYWDVLTKLISQDGCKIELPQSQVSKTQILQFLHFFNIQRGRNTTCLLSFACPLWSTRSLMILTNEAPHHLHWTL
jgi:hypothetical protein